MILSDIQKVLIEAAKEAGFSWSELTAGSSEVVLFGSTAMGMTRGQSDIDILLVVPMKRQRRTRIGRIDLVKLPLSDLNSPRWLGSELATHIATYGKWIKGEGKWRVGVGLGQKALDDKRKRIKARAESVIRNIEYMFPEDIRIHVNKIRRDCQRAERIERKVAGTCTPELDKIWDSCPDREFFLSEELRKAELTQCCSDRILSIFKEIDI